MNINSTKSIPKEQELKDEVTDSNTLVKEISKGNLSGLSEQ